jgi:hypothetical protein
MYGVEGSAQNADSADTLLHIYAFRFFESLASTVYSGWSNTSTWSIAP